MTLGERIVSLRNARGISQADLAEAMEVSRQSVSKWETGASTPDLDKLVRLAEYFGVSLDQLVKGEETAADDRPAGSEKVQEGQPPESRRTKAQSLGIFFLCLSAFAAILFAVLFGLWGVLFAAPIFLFGLICYFARKHPVLKAVWTVYILLSIYFHYGTAIDPTIIFFTFQWTAQMNYSILVFSWIWFFIVMALIIGTAIVLRDLGWSWTPKHIGELVSGFVLYGLSYVMGILAGYADSFFYLFYLLQIYLQLAGITILVTDVTRWAVSRRKAKNSGT